MIILNSSSSRQRNLSRPPPVDLSERIWNLHRTITDPTVERDEAKDAKRTLLGALIVQNELRNIVIPPMPATSVPARIKPHTKPANTGRVCDVCGSDAAAQPASRRNRISKTARAGLLKFRAHHFRHDRPSMFARRGRTQRDPASLPASEEVFS
ncbi:MAG: hypothetical protein ABI992_03325 [Chthoniobacterales bacterium]